MEEKLKLYDEIFRKNNYHQGRMISGSKSGYCKRYPDNEVYFNGNIVIKELGKIWWGDIDVTKDFNTLTNIANEIGQDLYILYESACRFANENLSIEHLIAKSNKIIKCQV